VEVTAGRQFLVSEVCRQLGIKPHILRYWEREFGIKPARNSARRRIYNEAQLERLQLIKHLVRNEKLTVKGARRQLTRMPAQPSKPSALNDPHQTLLWLKKELVTLRSILEA
jgi:DNA-binding transcriptional MerR regulator